MASIIGRGFSVEYNITDGEPREVFIDGRVIYRSPAEAARTRAPDNVPVDEPGWREELAQSFVAHGLNKPSPRYGGFHELAYWLESQGLVTLESSAD